MSYRYKNLHGIQNKTVLELGSGKNLYPEQMKLIKENTYKGIDINYENEVLNITKKNIIEPIEGKYDVIVAFDVLEHLNYDDWKKVLSNINCCLKNNGTFYLTVPYKQKLNFQFNNKKSEYQQHKIFNIDKTFVKEMFNSYTCKFKVLNERYLNIRKYPFILTKSTLFCQLTKNTV